MFRRLPSTLPKEPIVSANLERLGYFVNENDQIRQIRNPEQKYDFAVNRSERVNGLHKEAMNACIRSIVAERLQALGLELLRLPTGAGEKENHVPILVTKDIARKTRVIVLFGERSQDLGIFSYRTIGERGINAGSAVNFCKAILGGDSCTSGDNTPGLIIANPGQLHWYRGGSRAVSWREWLNLPRESAVHEPFKVDSVKNSIPGNRDYSEHIHYIFENVLRGLLNPSSSLDVVGLEYSGRAVLLYLAEHWSTWSDRITGICLGNPQHTVDEIHQASDTGSPGRLSGFLTWRCRAYFVSDDPGDLPLDCHNDYGCNCRASGEHLYPEAIIIKAWQYMLDWFKHLHADAEYQGPASIDWENDTEPNQAVPM